MNKEDRELLLSTLEKQKDGRTIVVTPPETVIRQLEEVCTSTGLDWKQRHCYLIERGGKWRVELSIDGFRMIANSDEEYAGQEGPFWTLGPDQPWTDIPPDKQPYAAKVGVIRQKAGIRSTTYGVAKFKDYSAGPMWTKFPSTMISKCAEMLALRKALPGKLGGLYGAEEMQQVNERSKAKAGTSAPRTESDSAQSTNVDGCEVGQMTFEALIRDAASAEELKAVGEKISKSGLGLETKMALSKQYNARKEKENWK